MIRLKNFGSFPNFALIMKLRHCIKEKHSKKIQTYGGGQDKLLFWRHMQMIAQNMS